MTVLLYPFFLRYCGQQLPPQSTSLTSQMTVTLNATFPIPSDLRFGATYVILDSASVCGGNYFTTTGVITSPDWPGNYPHNTDCSWVIHAPPGQQIRLNITVFDLERHSSCSYDYLEIRNGGRPTSPLIDRFCSNEIQPVITSFSNALFLHFKSDSSATGRGFEIFWDSSSTGCGGEITGLSGTIASPNYPLPYHNKAECTWTIHASKGSRIRIRFVDMQLERRTDQGADDSNSCM